MSEIEQANGIEIPAEVIRAAAEAMWMGRAEKVIRDALDAWGATVERNPTASTLAFGEATRIVTPWREVP